MDHQDDPFYSPADTGQVDRLLATIEFSKALVSAYDMETLLTAILERIKAIIPAANWSLPLIDPPTGELYFAVIVGLAPDTVKDIRLKPGEGIAGTVAQTGKPIFIPDVAQDPRFAARVDRVTGFDTRSIIALPLIVRGEVIGVFEVVNVEEERFLREKYLPTFPSWRTMWPLRWTTSATCKARGPHLYRRGDGVLQYPVSHPRTRPPHSPVPQPGRTFFRGLPGPGQF